MGRTLPVGAAVLLALTAAFFQAIELPGRVFACSCIGPPPPLAEVAREDQVSIVVGTVGQALPDRTPIVVEGWFHGAAPTDLVWLTGGSQMASSCDIFMTAGERRLFVLYASDGGLYSTNSCAPNGLLGTPDGNALLESAIQAFGSPQAPPTPEQEPEPPSGPSPWFGDGLFWAVGAVGAGLALLGAVALIARRRPAG